jgi:hypothetical protein
VPEQSAYVVERFGKYKKTLYSVSFFVVFLGKSELSGGSTSSPGDQCG